MINKILLFLLILFASYADIFITKVGINPLEPSDSIVPLFLILSIISYTIKDYLSILKTHTFIFMFSILILQFVYAIPSKASGEVIFQIIVREIMTICLYLFALCFFIKAKEKDIIIFFSLAILVLGGSVWYDFFIGLPAYDAYLAQSLRKGGFGENPNQSASALKFLFVGLMFMINKNHLFRKVLIFFIFASIFLTLSRSGILTFIIILFIGTFNAWNRKIEFDLLKNSKNIFKIIFLFASIYVSIVFFAQTIKDEIPAFTRGDAGRRLNLLTGQKTASTITYKSNMEDSRVTLFKEYLNAFLNNPWGHGTGFSADKSLNKLKSHNYYLYFAVNYGIIALLAYLFYLFFLFKKGFDYKEIYLLIFTLLLVFEGVFSHRILIERSILLTLAFFDSRIYLFKENTVEKDNFS